MAAKFSVLRAECFQFFSERSEIVIGRGTDLRDESEHEAELHQEGDERSRTEQGRCQFHE